MFCFAYKLTIDLGEVVWGDLMHLAGSTKKHVKISFLIITQAHVGYKMMESQQGAEHLAGYSYLV